MKNNFEESLKRVLTSEGGYVDNPHDPGGATMKGVTLKVYEDYLGRLVTKQELKDIPDEHIQDIYKRQFWDSLKCDDLPNGVDYLAFDFAVNAGCYRSAVCLQKAALIEHVDGAIGPKSIEAVNRCNLIDLINYFSQERRNFYRGLITFPTFGKGWLSRVETAQNAAKEMIG